MVDPSSAINSVLNATLRIDITFKITNFSNMKRFFRILTVLSVLMLPVATVAQSKPKPPPTGNTKKQKKRLAKIEKQRETGQEDASSEMSQRHLSIQEKGDGQAHEEK